MGPGEDGEADRIVLCMVEELAGGGVWAVAMSVCGAVWKGTWGIRAAGCIRHYLGVMRASDDGDRISVRIIELGGGVCLVLLRV